MGLSDRNQRGFRRLLRSFVFAAHGLKHVIKYEQNMQIHLICSIVVFAVAWWLTLPLEHWLVLLLVIGGMFSLEIMNTAVERTVDLYTEEFHPLAKRAKDVAAAAVFVYGVFAVIIGILIFGPPFIQILFY
ncbi:diacylglycerol kinase family protein [Alkalicoccobacillus plakortidis]|uniref:Diacylglycerol kinase family protein n=1 Tax=Alkalicoccobacillus plakortidis TaxID=444060 RepID=A0ABT0XRC8_9BACI|nr:diacylglycerol kinase family protein [Alkalicoccobacillus plakortidis]MCM2677847.1 diacylglycerol kinase family protein [Alkalicoccobacillus plakortidis]